MFAPRLLALSLLSAVLATAQLPQPNGGGSRIIRVPVRDIDLVPVPADPNEPVTSVPQTASSPAERSEALAILNRARQGQQLHMRNMPPYILTAVFTSTSGAGKVTETWMSGQKWVWSGNAGNDTAVRMGGDGLHFGSPKGGAIPPAVHTLRNAIFWAAETPMGGGTIRTAKVIWNGKPATCILLSPRVNVEHTGTRSWDEEEMCADDASGRLQVQSIVPGTYVDYTYAGAPFHNRELPSQITMFAGGSKVLDAHITMTDAGTLDESIFTPTEEMRSYGPVGTGTLPTRMTAFVPNPNVSGEGKPVIIHASVDAQGTLVATELSIASDPALVPAALEFLKKMPFPPNGNTRQIYYDVRFIPQP